AKGFRAFSPAPPLEHPTALWADERALPWVLDGSTLLRMTKDSGWARSEVPFASPLALAGSSSSEVWLAGEGGAALFDGTRFVCIRDLPGPFSGITRAGDDWWFWGAEGAFRLRRTPRD
ncbi:MAG TPA: hypothetical protein VFQ35_10470, partial [Polyangiaceae bacterium]|nr:hypothetical protein [Polyangiaceae bacterium]